MKDFNLEQELAAAFNDDQTNDSGLPMLALYMTPFCPFCIYVKTAIAQLGLDVEMRNIYEQQYFDELLVARQRATVPVLRITDNEQEAWLPESRDIVAYLKQLKDSSPS